MAVPQACVEIFPDAKNDAPERWSKEQGAALPKMDMLSNRRAGTD
jgi:hypothetical protein